MAEPRIQYAKTPDGVSIAYWTWGQGVPLVITPYHAASHIGGEWQAAHQRTILERLASERKIVRYDWRGTGLSERRSELSVESQAQDLEAVVDATCPGRHALLGRGFGGSAAIRNAATHQEQVSHLILYDAAMSTEDIMSEPSLRAQEAIARALTPADFESVVRIITRMVRGPDPEWLASFMIMSTDGPYMDLSMEFKDDPSALLQSIVCPALVIAERWPGETIDRAVRLCSRLAQAELVAIDRWNGDPWPDWADVTDHVYAFLGLASPSEAADARVITVLFTDLVGHTGMMQRLGDDKGRDVLREHERITRATLKEFGGAEVKTMGDGFMASFGSVTRAMDCAIALQRAFAAHTESMPEPLHVRVGLNAGEPIEEDGDLFGSTVILASRIAAQAGAGEILIPEPLRHLLSGKSYVYADRGETALKGFEDAVRLYEVRWRE